jgi:hypothetical protein
METKDIHIMMVQENNTNMRHKIAKQIIQEELKNRTNIKMIYSQTQYETTTTFKPGGTSIWIRNMEKYKSGTINDVIGRWTGVKLRFKSRQLTVISVYQPPEGSEVRGTTNVIAQQTRWYIEKQKQQESETTTQITRKYIKRKFREDLIHLLQTLKEEGYEIILGGDFNEKQSNDNIISNITDKMNMKELLRKFGKHDIATYIRGSNQIDKIFCTKNLLEEITNAELLGFETPVSSDHQPIEITLKIQNKNKDEQQQYNQQRTLTSNNMQSLTRYINAKYQMMKAKNIFKRIEKIQESRSIKEELDKIDQTITEINLKAETKIRKVKDNGWSTTIPKMKQKLTEINRKLRYLLKNKQGHEDEIKEVIKEKKSTIRSFRQYNQQSYKIRHEEMEEKIKELEKEKSPNEPKIRRLKMILQTERTKQTYKKIKGQIKRNQNRDINKIQVVQNDGSIIKYTETEEMAKQVAKYNKTHYNQANNTPLATYPDTHSEKYSQQYIQDCKMKQIQEEFIKNIEETNREQINYKIDDKTWKTKLMKWKEDTTTSPSGVHLGHYKAPYKPHSYTYEQNTEQKSKMDARQTKLKEL